MKATRLFCGAALIVCSVAAVRAESPPAWQAADFVMEEVVVTASPSAPPVTEEIVVTARVPARPGGELGAAAAALPALAVTPRAIEPPRLLTAGDVIRQQGKAVSRRWAGALWRGAVECAAVAGRGLL